ncbi:hypothetical protein [Aureimonas sp. AU12]|uniref:hypothetical protein n=1 Tax=Aureimonas sp. AU12 TaxID=1638161 RepID=UPI0009EB1B47|nr:hypothetical protein [Aureimonas sp. AU12]
MNVVCDAGASARRDPFDLALEDGAGCLAYLMNAAVRGGGSVADVVRGRPIAHLSARTLRTMGVALEPVPGSKFIAVATAHPALAEIFAPTLWIGDWATALLTLPGAIRSGRMSFGRVYAPIVLVPRQLLPGSLQ